HDVDRHQEARARPRGGRAGDHPEGGPGQDLPSGTAPARGRVGVDREVPPDARGPSRPARGLPRAHERKRLMSRSAQITTPSDREIRIERIFDAPRERVWQAMTDPALVAQWWGRGNNLVIQRMEVKRGGHWRFVEHGPDGVHGFEGRYREVVPPERLVQTFEWDGMPGHVVVETLTLEELEGALTRAVIVSLFHTSAERDGMLSSGMEQGLNQSHAALDKVLADMQAEATPRRAPELGVAKVAF